MPKRKHNNPFLSYPGHTQRKKTPLHDKIQIALLDTNGSNKQALKELVVNCQPSIIPCAGIIQEITAEVEVPISKAASRRIRSGYFNLSVDAILSLEILECCNKQFIEEGWSEPIALTEARNFQSFDEIIAALRFGGFSPEFIADLQHQFEAASNCNIPLVCYCLWADRSLSEPETKLWRIEIEQSLSRTSFRLFGKEYCPAQNLVNFSTGYFRVLVEIKTEIQSWGEVLRQIKRYREALNIRNVILICDVISDEEARGFMNQEISIYSATDLIKAVHAVGRSQSSIEPGNDSIESGQSRSKIEVKSQFGGAGSLEEIENGAEQQFPSGRLSSIIEDEKLYLETADSDRIRFFQIIRELESVDEVELTRIWNILINESNLMMTTSVLLQRNCRLLGCNLKQAALLSRTTLLTRERIFEIEAALSKILNSQIKVDLIVQSG